MLPAEKSEAVTVRRVRDDSSAARITRDRGQRSNWIPLSDRNNLSLKYTANVFEHGRRNDETVAEKRAYSFRGRWYSMQRYRSHVRCKFNFHVASLYATSDNLI